jgi:hypothetical protein
MLYDLIMAGFWKTYPLTLVLQSKLNTLPFLSQEFKRSVPQLSSEYSYYTVSRNYNYNPTQITLIREFIKTHFGSPPKTPVLDIPEHHLLALRDHIIFVTKNDLESIVGCIRYHYLGEFLTSNSEPIYCVDCFCIHPDYRKKGLGEFLLTTLHNYVNINNIPYSLFLKEGTQLSIVHTPLYSSKYVYRKLISLEASCKNVISLSPPRAARLINIFQKFMPELFIIINPNSQNQKWLLYKNNVNMVLACFQDTFQWFVDKTKTKNKIAWCTAWIESSNLTDNCREEAAKQLSDYFSSSFEYVWMNKVWYNSSTNTIWKEDGAFHWYTYQWCSASKINRSYCIMT